jgi:hypothetical protein
MENNIKYKEIGGEQYRVADPSVIDDSKDICFFIEGKHYRLAKGGIAYDNFKKRYVLKSSIQVENGFVGIDEDDTPILGGWSWPSSHLLEDNIIANYKGHQFYCISEDIFADRNWDERLENGEFYHKADLPVKEFSRIKAVTREVKNSFPYNAAGELKRSSKIYKERFSPTTYDKGVANYPKVLGKYSYGLEFETIKGIIPTRICNNLGLIPLRDGSIDGIEYATVPLEGKNALQTIIDSCGELQKRTIFNKDCSLHIHIGGMPRTEKFFIALAKVLCHSQEEMYSMFPFYTKGGFNLKKKDYTAPLPAVDLLSKINNRIDVKSKTDVAANFQHLFEFLSMGHSYRDYSYDLKNVVSHPSDPGGTSKWYVRSRYRWVNMIPLLFGNKKTIEFRIHTPTYDPNKIIYFSIICAALVDVAVRQEKQILEGTMTNYSISDLTYKYLAQFGDKYATVHSKVNNYIEDRKRMNIRNMKKGDFYGNEDAFIGKDSLYTSTNDPYAFLTKGKIHDLLHNTEPESLYRPARNITFGDAGSTAGRWRNPTRAYDPAPVLSEGFAVTSADLRAAVDSIVNTDTTE